MIIRELNFLGSFPDVSRMERSELPEFAFMGRSNVGKSSLINMLCQKKDLAKTSGTPGKTQMLNLFNINGHWNLCDLPGYGYARISKKMREKWARMINKYLGNRENLKSVFILLDVRLKPLEIDREQILYLAERAIPFAIVFTKSDKLSPKEANENILLHKAWLSEHLSTMPNLFVSSAQKKSGRDEILDYISFLA